MEIRMSTTFESVMKGLAAVSAVTSLFSVSTPAHAWGDEGHEVVGLIAEHYLSPGVLTKVNQILATDTTGLTPNTQIDQEATWADKFRDSDRNTTKIHFNETHNWHFI